MLMQIMLNSSVLLLYIFRKDKKVNNAIFSQLDRSTEHSPAAWNGKLTEE